MPIGFDPLVNFKFWVVIDGITVAQFRECDGLSISVKVIEHRSPAVAGLGPPVLRKLPGQVSFEDIVLKRGKINDHAFWKWMLTVQKGKVDEARKTGSIVLYDFAAAQATEFTFKEGWPSMVEVDKLQAHGNDVLLETVRITHEGLAVTGVGSTSD